MAALWNPRTLLGVNPDGSFTCVGTTQKGARCRNSFFSNSDLTKASILLNRMASSQPKDARPHLSHLAEMTLCPRWHRKPGYSQVKSMERTWWNAIVCTYPGGIVPVPATSAVHDPEPEEESTRRESLSTGLASQRRALRTPPQSPSPAPRTVSLSSSAPVATAIAPVVVPASVIQAPSPVEPQGLTIRLPASSAASSSSASTAAAIATPPATPSPPQSPTLSPAADQEEDETISLPISASTVVASSSQTTPLTPPRTPPSADTWLPLTPEAPIKSPPCPHSSRRKPLTDDCPICNEEMHCPDDAVWCRAQCGQNMHRGCFAMWRRECLARNSRNAVVTCVYCREPWKYEWED